jgi:hypothetical protein
MERWLWIFQSGDLCRKDWFWIWVWVKQLVCEFCYGYGSRENLHGLTGVNERENLRF